MVYVVDTHALVWFLTKDTKLGEKAREIFEKTERGEGIIIIPVIVLAELLHICEKNNLLSQFKEILERLRLGLNYMVFELDLETIAESVSLNKVPELHDKIITAVARLLRAKLITRRKEPRLKSRGFLFWCPENAEFRKRLFSSPVL